MFFAVLFSTLALGQPQLDFFPEPIYQDRAKDYRPSDFVMAANGKCLINEYAAVYAYDPQTKTSIPLELPTGFYAYTFSYLPLELTYCVGAHQPDDKISRLFFFSEEGIDLGTGWFEDQPGTELTEDFPWRQIIPAGEKVFANIWQESFMTKNRPGMLREIELSPIQGGFLVSPVSEAFDPQVLEANTFNNNFKNRWIVARDNSYWVLDEVQHQAWVFKESFSAEYRKSGFRRSLNLKNRVSPVELQQVSSRHKDFQKWFYSFSRVTGFYAYRDGFLVGYVSPNRSLKDYGGSLDGSDESRKSTRFVLYLQSLDSSLKPDSAEMPFDSEPTFLIGVHKNVIFLFQGTRDQPESRRVFSLMPDRF